MFRSLVAKPSHRNYRIWRGPSVFLPGLVPMCHQSRSKIHTWDPAAKKSTLEHTFRLQLVGEVKRGDCVLSFYLLATM